MDHRNITLWLRYAETEMRNKQINHARNLWDRAVTILPRANQFWYKYTYMEEMLGNVAGQTLEDVGTVKFSGCMVRESYLIFLVGLILYVSCRFFCRCGYLF